MNKLYKKMLSLINKLMKDRYLPSWVIILIDFGICVFAAFVSGFILGGKEKYFNFPLDSYSARFLILSIVLTTSFLILFKVAKGVIRYSTFSDAMRIFFAVVFSCLLMLLINLTYKYKIDPLEKDLFLCMLYWTLSFPYVCSLAL